MFHNDKNSQRHDRLKNRIHLDIFNLLPFLMLLINEGVQFLSKASRCFNL